MCDTSTLPSGLFTCLSCGELFTMSHVQQVKRKNDAKRGKLGPFCSRGCAGRGLIPDEFWQRAMGMS